ncbi:DUF3048 domain-containing protein [Nocardioides sp. TRM66260-LWL]|uniref:DUF3048 domain-containing protein n=1 Tax=Nocardioides sp. TRM66260-LWL TaxID=2874478 RepID=UPI001CC4F0F5|nr:DUF3048 domain-containing protein [Nocardioides sp. TRM66260-LWL]MBZ5732926.1 DUF3048 domain-containing protein [Nocardioides sp. TRM66260-LWL]
MLGAPSSLVRESVVRRCHPTVSRVLPALGALVALSLPLALGGCGGSAPAGVPAASGPSGAAAGAAVPDAPPVSPLTGRRVDAAAAARPVLAVKIDNTYASAPQIGLGKAELVVEELVEGGLTRLAAFYQSSLPAKVGPVRSMRASDIGIVSPVGADIVTSGAAQRTIRRIKGAGITFFEEGAKGFSRDPSRRMPYNLFADLTKVVTLVKPHDPPAPYLPFGAASDLPSGPRATTIAARFGGGRTSQWTYEDGAYRNTNSFAADGDRFAATNVLVLRVRVGDAGYRDPAGNPVPETRLIGTGRAMLFSRGRVVRATWSKADLTSPLELSAGGTTLTVPTGRTWIELVPAKDGSVTVGR